MNIITTDKAPAAIGPYSQAIAANNMVFFSGQIGIDPVTGQLQEGFEAQIQQIFSNIEGVMQAAGVAKTNIVKTTVFLASMNDYALFNDLYGQFFRDHKPARTTVAAAALPKAALIEIEVLAVIA